ncbi:MAG: 23S rRNA (guanosine(2251)-2'-O)-methyltransferase RlmB [Betaproteobacteria bacterium]|nr:23S rRNA (guanosine(2251)-2'-O)-methyltransferase RlmB [Betaproteobacteria bacterium]
MSEPTQFIYGFHVVTARLRHAPESVTEIYIQQGRRDARGNALAELAQSKGVKVLPMEAQRLDGMAGGARHQGVVARATVNTKQADLDDILDVAGDDALILLLDSVTDPHNLGACLRVADFFGAHAVVAPKDRAVGLTPAVLKVASGAAETVPYLTITNLARTIGELQERGVRVLGAALGAASPLSEADLTGPIAWAVGAEGEGLRRLTRERCDALVEIPRLGTVESLNLSVAAALCLYETRRQRSITKPPHQKSA